MELGSDKPYVLVTAVDLASTVSVAGFPVPIPAFEVTLYGPFGDVDTGESFDAPGAVLSFWGIRGNSTPLTDPNAAVFLVAILENDDGNPKALRGIVKGEVGSSVLATMGSNDRNVKLAALVRDMDSALGTPTGGPNFDDRIGGVQELRFTQEELSTAESGQTVSKILTFVGDGAEYELIFDAAVPDAPPLEAIGTFALGGPTRDMEAMSQFRHRSVVAGKMGFAAGFPNFYFAHYERDHVGGTILLRPDGVEWRDVPLGDLHDVALTSFADRMRATQLYATDHGFVGGFPNFFHADDGHGTVCGTVLLKPDAAEFRDVPLAELTHHDLDNLSNASATRRTTPSRTGTWVATRTCSTPTTTLSTPTNPGCIAAPSAERF